VLVRVELPHRAAFLRAQAYKDSKITSARAGSSSDSPRLKAVSNEDTSPNMTQRDQAPLAIT
jgi:hypothetical protein